MSNNGGVHLYSPPDPVVSSVSRVSACDANTFPRRVAVISEGRLQKCCSLYGAGYYHFLLFLVGELQALGALVVLAMPARHVSGHLCVITLSQI